MSTLTSEQRIARARKAGQASQTPDAWVTRFVNSGPTTDQVQRVIAAAPAETVEALARLIAEALARRESP